MLVVHHILPLNPNQRVSLQKSNKVKDLVFQFVKDEYYARRRQPGEGIDIFFDYVQPSDAEIFEEIRQSIQVKLYNKIRAIDNHSFPPYEDNLLLERIRCKNCQEPLSQPWLNLFKEATETGIDLDTDITIQCPMCQTKHNPNQVADEPYFASFDIAIYMLLTIKSKNDKQKLYEEIEAILGFDIEIHNEHND